MIVREVLDGEKELYNSQINHIIQSWEWGEFRKKTGLDLVRLGHFESDKLIKAYQLTFHPVPFFGKTIGYLPKGPMIDREMIGALVEEGNRKKTAFIKIEPNVILDNQSSKLASREEILSFDSRLVVSGKSLFTKYNFLIDLTKSENELLGAMHPKTRYNIGVAQKKGVEVYESTSGEDFEIYLKLFFETTKRQGYFGHTREYHKLVWETLYYAKMARVLIAKYQGKPLVAWMLFNFGDTLYYPYGGSSNEHKEVMASNLVAWEAIRLGRKMGMRVFDMWGALAPNAKDDDPWYGFHRFKAGYGPIHVEYVGTFDLVLMPQLYNILIAADKIRWAYLRTIRR